MCICESLLPHVFWTLNERKYSVILGGLEKENVCVSAAGLSVWSPYFEGINWNNLVPNKFKSSPAELFLQSITFVCRSRKKYIFLFSQPITATIIQFYARHDWLTNTLATTLQCGVVKLNLTGLAVLWRDFMQLNSSSHIMGISRWLYWFTPQHNS